jgi:hypothetical protein
MCRLPEKLCISFRQHQTTKSNDSLPSPKDLDVYFRQVFKARVLWFGGNGMEKKSSEASRLDLGSFYFS